MKFIDKHFAIIMSVLFAVFIFLILNRGEGHEELRNDMPVVPNALTFCFMRYDSKDSGERDTYLECNMVGGFTQEQLKNMRQTLEEWVQK